MALVYVAAPNAGRNPAGYVHPRALALPKAAELSTERLSSQPWHNLPLPPDAVITLCADAVDEACPLYFDKIRLSHWGMPNPAKVQGCEAATNAAFTETLAALHKRIKTLVKQLEEEPGLDEAQLQAVLDGIALL